MGHKALSSGAPFPRSLFLSGSDEMLKDFTFHSILSIQGQVMDGLCKMWETVRQEVSQRLTMNSQSS